jgi:hypothetical protein
LLIELLQLGRQHGYDRLASAIERALGLGLSDAAGVRHLLLAGDHDQPMPPPLEMDASRCREHYHRPLPEVLLYDDLLGSDWQGACKEVAQ